MTLALALTAGLFGIAPTTPAAADLGPTRELSGRAGFFQPVRTNGYTAWQRNTVGNPNRFDVFVQRDGQRPQRINRRPGRPLSRGNAANGDIRGDLFVFQSFAGRRSNLRLFDLKTQRFRRVPRGVNTARWEYWPSMSGRWLLFGRVFPNGARRLILRNMNGPGARLLARTRSPRAFLQPGQVNGRWAVWSICPARGKCNVVRYDIRTRKRMRIPNRVRWSHHRSPSVTRNGTVYFARTGARCGARPPRLMRFEPGEGISLVTRLRRGRDISSTYAFDDAGWNNAVYYENNVCRNRTGSTLWQAPDPTRERDDHLLKVEKDEAGTGDGTVTSNPAGIDCGDHCDEPFPEGETVTLTAIPDDRSNFADWDGCDQKNGNKCTVTMDSPKEVTATFNLGPSLNVSHEGTGNGTVTGNSPAFECSTGDAPCERNFTTGTVVTLTAEPHVDSDFVEWGEDQCDETDGNTCTVTMNAPKEVTATFNLGRSITVSHEGDGNGTVTSDPEGLDCATADAPCTQNFTTGSEVTLTASAQEGSSFTGWGGDCADAAGKTCTLTMDDDHAVTATFQADRTLTVNKEGSGVGTVTSSPAGINCGIDCDHDYEHGMEVKLTAIAASGSTFEGWGGACSGTHFECTVAMDQNRLVTAEFSGTPRTLSVTKSGEGQGRVTSDPVGIDCGNDCSESYGFNEQVTLTATANLDSDFVGWGGGHCTEQTALPEGGTCKVTMDANKTVTATFEPGPPLTVNVESDSGTGTVTSEPAGINCGTGGADCEQRYTTDTLVTLTAAADADSDFTGWSGACAGETTEVCTVTMDGAKNVTATFTLKTYNLNVTVAGTGTGSVNINPPNTDCATADSPCTETYDHGDSVTLTATEDTGSDFAGWNGACAGEATEVCTVTMNGAKNVTATFTLKTYALNVSVDGDGTVTSDPAGIDCEPDCTETYEHGQQVELTANPGADAELAEWGEACAGETTNVCTVTMDGAKSVTATFQPLPASQLAVTANPDASYSADDEDISVTVEVQNANGTVVTTYGDEISLTLVNANGATLGGTTFKAPTNGVATFNNLFVRKAGEGYVLRASSGSLSTADTSAFSITPGVATKLVIATHPEALYSADDNDITTVVEVHDAHGNKVTTDTSEINLTLLNANGAVLEGTTTRNAVDGEATFDDLSVRKAGQGYALRAESGTLEAADTTTFDVVAGAPAQYLVTSDEDEPVAGEPVTITAQLADAYGNPIAEGDRTVNWTSTGGGSFSDDSTTTNDDGIATVTFTTSTTEGTVHTVTATDADDETITGTSDEITTQPPPP